MIKNELTHILDTCTCLITERRAIATTLIISNVSRKYVRIVENELIVVSCPVFTSCCILSQSIVHLCKQ